VIHSESRGTAWILAFMRAMVNSSRSKFVFVFVCLGAFFYVRESLARNEWNGAGNTVYETRRVGTTRRLTDK
jgi:hypothetical protein